MKVEIKKGISLAAQSVSFLGNLIGRLVAARTNSDCTCLGRSITEHRLRASTVLSQDLVHAFVGFHG